MQVTVKKDAEVGDFKTQVESRSSLGLPMRDCIRFGDSMRDSRINAALSWQVPFLRVVGVAVAEIEDLSSFRLSLSQCCEYCVCDSVSLYQCDNTPLSVVCLRLTVVYLWCVYGVSWV